MVASYGQTRVKNLFLDYVIGTSSKTKPNDLNKILMEWRKTTMYRIQQRRFLSPTQVNKSLRSYILTTTTYRERRVITVYNLT